MEVKEKYSTGEKWLSLGMAKSLPEAIQNELNVERLLLLQSHKPTTAITLSLISFSNIAFLWQSQNPVYLCFWLVAFQGLALWTLLNWRRNHKKPRPKTIRPGRWSNHAQAGIPADRSGLGPGAEAAECQLEEME